MKWTSAQTKYCSALQEETLPGPARVPVGLPIAHSFTQICGGRFNIKIDGDLFKVELCFKQ
jgi:hypothetical protein